MQLDRTGKNHSSNCETSDYKIARKINTDPHSVTRYRKNAHKKLTTAKSDVEWAKKIGIPVTLT